MNKEPGRKRRELLKKAGLASLVAAAGLVLSLPLAAHEPRRNADHVRWDIVSLVFATPPSLNTLNPDGPAFAFAYHTPGNPSAAKIRLTGSGTFVAPASGGSSRAVTGGGTWATSGPGLLEHSGTYRVTRLVSWEFDNFQTGNVIDNIGDVTERANGTAVFLIEYDDGTKGMLGVGCHGPGADNGILEGVIATKGFVTYWNGVLPAPGVDENRTLFHVRR